MSVWLLQLEALDAGGNPVTLRYANDAYDADGETWRPRLRQPALFADRAWGGWFGRTERSGVGNAELINADGALDMLADYALDGRSLRVWRYDGTLTQVLAGTVIRSEVTRNAVRLILRDLHAQLQEPHPMQLYAGSNSGGQGLEGTQDDIAGTRKPLVLGDVRNAVPVLVNYGKQIYQVSSDSDCSITAAYDRGVELTDGGAYASLADLQDDALAPASGAFRAYQGYVRLGDTATGTLTVDATQASTSAGAVASALCAAAGYTLDSSDAAALTESVGIYLTDERSTESLLDEIARSVGGYWYFEDDGTVRMRRLAIGTPSRVIPSYRVLDITRDATGAGENGLPVHRVTLRADRVAHVQTDLAAAVPQARAARVAREYRDAIAEDAATKSRHPLSRPLVLDTALRNLSDAQTRANALRDLLKVRRDRLRVTLTLSDYGDMRVGETITLEYPRLGYDSGRDMLVLGREPDARRGKLEVQLWG